VKLEDLAAGQRLSGVLPGATVDEDDPRYGIVLEKITDVAKLIAALNRTTTQLHGEKAWRQAGMRAIAEAVAETDGDWSLN